MKIFGFKTLGVLALAAALGIAPAALAQGAQAPAATSQNQASAAAPAANPTTPVANAAAPTANAAAPTANAAAPAASTVPHVAALPVRAPEPGIGQPDGRMGIQEQVTPIGQEGKAFHDWILMPAIVIITLIVLLLMLYVIFRYRRAAHPVPSRTTHNTLVEVIWTLVPVLILVAIAVPSIQLISKQYSPPPADLTVKVIGNQWYWTYQYPDNGVEVTSNMLPEPGEGATPDARTRTAADGPRLLAVDERLVVPVGAVVKLIVTSADVIHDFAVPAFWVKMDAVPGRLNETWFKAEREGVYFGQCSELCGARHAFMPIAVQVVSQAEFQQYILSKGGHMPGTAAAAATPANPDATHADPVPAAAANQARGRAGEPLTPTNQVQATGNAAPVRERSPEPTR